MTQKQIAADILKRYMAEQLSARQDRSFKEQFSQIMDSDAFGEIERHPKQEELDEFCDNLMNAVIREVYDKNRDKVLDVIYQEVDYIVENLFDEEEATQIVTFLQTPVGKKVLRNLDMMRDAYGKGATILATETVIAWSNPAIAEAIENFILFLNQKEEPEE